jgi:hypothetical protein
MYTEQLSQSLSIAAAPIDPQSVAPGTIDTGGIDMSKFRRARFILHVGAFGTNATVDMKLQESNASDFSSGVTDVAGAAITPLAAGGGNNRLASIEVRAGQLSKRYVRARVTVGTAATILQCLPLGSEAVHEPANVNDVAAVAQRLVV